MKNLSKSLPIPQTVDVLLREYMGLLHGTLPGFLEGLYLHGSLALGAYDPRFSDIDFIAVASRRCTPRDVRALRDLHQTLANRNPRGKLEGTYLCWDVLGRSRDAIPPCPCYHDRVLEDAGYHEINSVTWWVLKHHGIAVVGPPADQLDFDVTLDTLLSEMRKNMNTYWVGFTRKPRRLAWLLTDGGVQWAVLGVLRQLYRFREHAITSKMGAGRYALDYVPPRWHRIIREALRIREGKPGPLFRSRISRVIETRAFLRFIIGFCSASFQKPEGSGPKTV